MPIWISDRLILASPADAEYIQVDPCSIVLNAEQAFGTGTHPTTQMCLLELQAHLAGGDRVLANLDSAGDAKSWLPTLSRFCRPGGKIILSGFQAPGEGAVVTALGGANLRRLDRRAQGGWITFVLGKQP